MRRTYCLVGLLFGDALMTLPALVDKCSSEDVHVIVGSYALPVWEWARQHVVGANYTIDEVIDDPDKEQTPMSPFTPGYGYIAMDAALNHVREYVPDALGVDAVGSYYNKVSSLKTHDVPVVDGEHIVVHPYTRHDWKNVNDIVAKAKYPGYVRLLGLPGECNNAGWTNLTGQPFEIMVREVLSARFMVGVLSSFTNLAAIFNKRQIIVSFTSDVPIANPRARIMVTPTLEQLQKAIDEECAA